MNPCVTTGGRSFHGSYLYYMHDKDSDSRDRVAWTHTENMLTRDPDLAWKVMAYTAKSQDRLKEASGQVATGRKCEKPVMAYSLSWHPEQNPDKDHMLETALDSLKLLGLSEHECMIVAHRDTPHRHVHVIVNRIHPITGLVASNSHSYRKLSSFALEYAREHGLDYSPQREENAKKRENGQDAKYRDNRIQEAWDKSDNGRSLIAALEASGLTLAHGNKRLVVIDPKGKAVNPVRHINGIQSKDFNERLVDVNLSAIPKIDDLRRNMKSVRDSEEPEKTESESETDRLHQIQQKSQEYLDNLKQYYCYEEQKQEINRLESRISKTTWWQRILGITRKDKKQLKIAQKTLSETEAKIKRHERILNRIEEKSKSARDSLEGKSTSHMKKLEFPKHLSLSKNDRQRIAKEKRSERDSKSPSREM